MNPRVSRSSALASKATGFPIAKVAAKLAVGYTLDELTNDITGVTPASFEPTIDYVVVKIPRFAFEKYKSTDPALNYQIQTLTTQMKSVGEAMAIGRTFHEALQKALRSLETGISGFDEQDIPSAGDRSSLVASISRPTEKRLLNVGQAFREGLSIDEVHTASRIDKWFLRQISEIIAEEASIKKAGLPKDAAEWTRIKAMGFSDVRLAKLTGNTELNVRTARHKAGVRPVFKRIDTCAAEFAARTPYLYSTYEQGWIGPDGKAIPAQNEAEPSTRKKAMILGGGPNRIGQGIEFDYCCCHAAFAMADLKIESIMVNCNPETVSTDYDTSDRLYFEPLTLEDVTEIIHVEQSTGDFMGVIVQFGGQTPLKLAQGLKASGAPILGTTPDSIDLAEDRELFSQLIDRIGLKQAPSAIARTDAEAIAAANRIGYPVMLRPSFVLGGRAMEIVHDEADLKRYVREAVQVSGDTPLLVDRYLADAIEVDVDALSDGKTTHVAGIMEHIEEAGIHSGDSACSIPPYTLGNEIVDRLADQARKLAMALNVKGLMNVQFAVKGEEIYVLEANPRASRTVPFVAKAVGQPFASIAAKVMAGESLASFGIGAGPIVGKRFAVKEAVFPFSRFPGVDPLLGPEMRSTGEVMGIDTSFDAAYLKAQIAASMSLPASGCVFISVRESDKPAIEQPARDIAALGFTIIATAGTAKYLADKGINVQPVNKVAEGQPHVVDALINGKVQLVFNTTEGAQSLLDSASIRRAALAQGIPYYTTISGARAVVQAIRVLKTRPLEAGALQTYS
jgi:carbamoyl-phosphate synthase large subunit